MVRSALASLNSTALNHNELSQQEKKAVIPMESYTVKDLEGKRDEFEAVLQEAGLTENTVRTYVDRSQRFLDWLAGRYSPRGPNR
jgi:hypothetical protein